MRLLILFLILFPSLSFAASSTYIRPGELYKKGRTFPASPPKYRYDSSRDKKIVKDFQDAYERTLKAFDRMPVGTSPPLKFEDRPRESFKVPVGAKPSVD